MQLWQSTVNQIHIMIKRIGFMLSLSLVLMYCLINYIVHVWQASSLDVSQMLNPNALFALGDNSPYWSIFMSLYPFIVLFPFSFSFIEDLKWQTNVFLVSRLSTKHYLNGKIIATFIGGFIIIFLPFMLNLLLCHLTFPNNLNTYFYSYGLSGYLETLTGTNVIIDTVQSGLPFLKLYIKIPTLYGILMILVFSIFSGILSAFALGLSMLGITNRLVLMLPLFFLFYISRIIDRFSYSSSIDSGVPYRNYDWLSYFPLDTRYGKDFIALFLLTVFLMLVTVAARYAAAHKLLKG